MADRGDYAVLAQQRDGLQGAGALGGDRHHPQRAVGQLDQLGQLGQVGIAKERGILCAATDVGQVWALRSGCPRERPSATSGAKASKASRMTSKGEETRLASMVVVPWRRWKAAAPRACSASPVVKVCPPPPWVWMSTKPGRIHLFSALPLRIAPIFRVLDGQ